MQICFHLNKILFIPHIQIFKESQFLFLNPPSAMSKNNTQKRHIIMSNKTLQLKLKDISEESQIIESMRTRRKRMLKRQTKRQKKITSVQ